MQRIVPANGRSPRGVIEIGRRWSENRFRASRVVGASGHVGTRLKFGAEHVEFGPNPSLRVAPKDHPMSRRFRCHDLIDRIPLQNPPKLG